MPWKSAIEAEAFVQQYADHILRLALTYSLSRADAQDVCQNVFIKLLQSDIVFETPAAERAYVLRTVANACRDLLRSPWRRKRTDLTQAECMPTPEHDPMDLAVRTAVQQLPLPYRTPVYLFYFEGYDTAEIAKILSISPGAVRKRLSRARTMLKDDLERSIL